MSWLARSLANSLRLEDDDDGGKGDDDDEEDSDVLPVQPHVLPPQRLLDDSTPSVSSTYTRKENRYSQPHQYQDRRQQELQYYCEERDRQYSNLGNESPSQPQSEYEFQSRGVKDDLNEFKQTLARQFWGMANFLAPPPTDHSHLENQTDPTVLRDAQFERQDFRDDDQESVLDVVVSGNRGELSEMEAQLRNGVSETHRRDPNWDRFGPESEKNEESGNEEWNMRHESGIVGITEEVLAFSMNIAMHPETWLDFPIEEEEDTDDFQMTAAQKYHALAIERLAPRLAALRIELCPCHMSESYFWKVYFVLLHSRLNKEDAEVLSTFQVMAARAKWMQELHKPTHPESDWFSTSTSYSKDVLLHDDPNPGLLNDSCSERSTPRGAHIYESITSTMRRDFETEKHMVETSEMHYVDKPVIEERPVIKTEMKNVMIDQLIRDCDDDNDWPDDDSDFGGLGGTTIAIENEDDISFSDLEDDNFDKVPVKSNTVRKV